MDESKDPNPFPTSSRREFLKTSTALAAGALAGPLMREPRVYAAGSDLLRVGLIGCGGRGTGAIINALKADKGVKLVAMGDAFSDRLQESLDRLKRNAEVSGQLDVPPERSFVGFDAYKQVIAATDVVLLCTPPHFRPLHLQAAVAAGKHVFAEKPVAVDAAGVRSVLATCAEAKKKNLSIVAGLQNRYASGLRDLVQRVHDGAIGQILSIQANDFRGPIWVRPRQPDWSDMYWQMRNWYYFTWLSGDFNVEQHVHLLDVCSWVKGEYPVRAVGTGGRQVRTGPEYGHIYDHHSVVYEFANGVKCFSVCRQQEGCANDISNHVMGSKGTGLITEGKLSLSAGSGWRYREKANDFYQTEHDELFASIRAG